jgi:hypothetical protein
VIAGATHEAALYCWEASPLFGVTPNVLVRLKRIVRFVLSCDVLGQFLRANSSPFLSQRTHFYDHVLRWRLTDGRQGRKTPCPPAQRQHLLATQPLLPSSPSAHVCPRTQMRDALWSSVTVVSPLAIALVFSAVSWRRIRGISKGALIVLPLTISSARSESPSRMRMRDWFRGGKQY